MDFNNAVWRKSSFSTDQTNCVEIAWRKSSFSGTETACVEIARRAGMVGIRDSKCPKGGYLTVPHTALHQLRQGLGRSK